jgi:RNA polymerase sigma factor (sigma-70 family)
VWIYKVAKNRCLMSRRRSKFAPSQELSLEELIPDRRELEELGADVSVNPEMFAIRSQEAASLRAAIQRLPPQYRIVLVLRDMEGLTDEEVAEITGLRPGTVRVRLYRARLFVRKELVRVGKPRPRRVAGGVAARVVGSTQPRPMPRKAMVAELSDYLDERLDDSLCEELERHLGGCEPCKVFLATLEAAIVQCRNSLAGYPTEKAALKLRKELLENYRQAVAVVKPGIRASHDPSSDAR